MVLGQSPGLTPPWRPAAPTVGSMQVPPGVSVGFDISGRFCSVTLSFTKSSFGPGSGTGRGLQRNP